MEEFEDLIVADRDGAIVRLSDVARVELGAEEADDDREIQRPGSRLPRRVAAAGSNEIEVAQALRDEMERMRPTLPEDIEMRLAGTARCS